MSVPQPRTRRSGRLLLVVLHFLEVGVHDVITARAARLLAVVAGAGTGIAATRARLAIEGLAEFHRGLRQRRGLGLDALEVVGADGLLQLGNRRLDLGLVVG